MITNIVSVQIHVRLVYKLQGLQRKLDWEQSSFFSDPTRTWKILEIVRK